MNDMDSFRPSSSAPLSITNKGTAVDMQTSTVNYVARDGHLGYSYVGDTSIGIRPTISLIPGIQYSSGDGSMANPYVVQMN